MLKVAHRGSDNICLKFVCKMVEQPMNDKIINLRLNALRGDNSEMSYSFLKWTCCHMQLHI